MVATYGAIPQVAYRCWFEQAFLKTRIDFRLHTPRERSGAKASLAKVKKAWQRLGYYGNCTRLVVSMCGGGARCGEGHVWGCQTYNPPVGGSRGCRSFVATSRRRLSSSVFPRTTIRFLIDSITHNSLQRQRKACPSWREEQHSMCSR